MTEPSTTEQKTESGDQVRDGEIPETTTPAVAIPPPPGQKPLILALSLTEVACIAASLQTAIHSGWIRQTSDVNTANSILRKIHDAKVQYVKDNP